MKRKRAINYGREVERRGDIFTAPSAPSTLAPWMLDRSLLPKSPPKRSNPNPERSRSR